LRALSIPLLACMSLLPVSSQTGASRQLTLVHPEDSAFDSLLNANFPGIQNLESYGAIRPFLVVLRNDTSHRGRAYVIQWEIQRSDGMLDGLQAHHIQKPFAPGKDRRTLVPSEVRLISPFFDLSPAEYLAQKSSLGSWMTAHSSLRPYSFVNILTITATVDAVIYEDGTYVGTDRFQLLTRYQALRDAERDESAAVLQLLSANPAPADIVALLERDAQAGLAVKLSPARDANTLYVMEYPLQRGYEAQMLLALYRQSGLQALKDRAMVVASYPRETIARLPGN
jgi:hypothetical protein